MKAVVVDRYGPPGVRRVEDVERPVPQDHEVLIKIHATTVNRSRLWSSRSPSLVWALVLCRHSYRLCSMDGGPT
jgi:D-arabinose 1-dehydrogenase-like Zn-dependent alcohol dehydrogenase